MSEKRDQIIAAALAIADERGLEAVSMRSVADRVGVSAMALYPHVAGKDALLDGMLELLLSELMDTTTSEVLARSDWSVRLTSVARGVRWLARRHPSAFSLLLARPSVLPDALRAVDVMYQVLLDAGVPEAEVDRLERLVSTFALGYAASEVNGRFGKGSLNPRDRREQLPPEEIPAHYRLAEYLDGPIDWSAEFEADLADLRRLVESVAGQRDQES